MVVPPIINISSSEDTDDNDVAFKIINNDNLPMSVVGESMLKPFGRDANKQKPNVIVYPTRRVPNALEESKTKPFTRSNGHINNNNNQQQQQQQSTGNISNKRNLSHSHGNLTARKPDDLDKSFTRTLDAKLRKLQRDERANKRVDPQQQQQQQQPAKRPLFVTTVKKGTFLQPPPEIASLLGFRVDEDERKDKKKLYSYASKPRILNRTANATSVKIGHKARCEAAAKAAAAVAANIAGIQHAFVGKDVNSNNIPTANKRLRDAPMPYANLMYERRIIRGSTYAQHPMPTGEGESAAARAAEARRRAMARRKAHNQQLRAAELRLGSPPPVAGRRHEPVQTDQYLEEIWCNPPAIDTCTQTDLFLDRPVSPFYVPAKTGVDVQTQIYPGDLFDFDMEVQPILEVLVGKTIEQALVEVLEEEELEALREQQRRFLEIRAAELSETQRLEEREARLLAEKDRRMAEHEEGAKVQKEMEERIAAAVLTQGYMADLLPSVLDSLEEDGYLVDNIKQELDASFMPWLVKEVTTELQEMVSSRDLLADIVREILETRAEIYAALNAEKPEEASEEEGPSVQDIDLAQHMKLQEDIAEMVKNELVQPKD